MKRAVALLFSIIYLVFATAALWQVDGAAGWAAPDSAPGTISGFTLSCKECPSASDIIAAGLVAKVPKHTYTPAKRKAPRALSEYLAFRNIFHRSDAATGYYKSGSATASLYTASVFIKNRVLRI